MNNSITTTSGVKKYDKLSVASFVLGMISVIIGSWTIDNFFNMDLIGEILSRLDHYLFFDLDAVILLITPIFPIITISLAIPGIMEVRDKQKRGLYLAIIGLVEGAIILSAYLYFFFNF